MKENSIQSEKIKKSIREKSAKYWEKSAEKKSLELFHSMAVGVPAYKDFLKSRKINHNSIKTHEDLQFVPPITKANYLREYDLNRLSWGGHMKTPRIYTSTSGSTGNPVFFSRSQTVNEQSAVIHELFLDNAGFSKKEPTLIINAFSMGVWIGGLITFQAFDIAAQNGYPLSIVTPGINKREIIRILSDVGPHYKQVLITGYPPFVKDVLDEAAQRKVLMKATKYRLLFAAEPFTEKFRSYVAKKASLTDSLVDTSNIYGSADLGTMAFETPLSIVIRQLASKNSKLFAEIFPTVTKTPTLAQYVPTFTNFQNSNGEILISGDSTLPLMRYGIGDHGGVITYQKMETILESFGISPKKELSRHNLGKYNYELPFVYVYERKDFSTTLYGLQIYPEPIREVLLAKPYDKLLTGKFTLITKYDGKQDQYLEINLEIKKDRKITKAMESKLAGDIVNALRRKSSEFRELSDFLEDRSSPSLVFWPSEDPLYFKPGVKQRWVTKTRQNSN